MALVHSLWTKPMLKNSRGENFKKQIETTVWCTASSVAYAKKNNEEIHLYADGLGYDLLSFLPYDYFSRLSVPDYIPTEFWAAGKFYALLKMNLGDIHIDNDVFLKTPALIEEMKKGLSKNDLIIQSIEDSWQVLNSYYKLCRDVIKLNNIEFNHDLQADYSPAYNCGVVGINNKELKSIYLESYINNMCEIYSCPKAMDMIRNNENVCMDLLLEQQHLYNLVENNGYKTYNLLGSGNEVYEKAEAIGYQHLLGSEKWILLDKIKEQLKNLNPDIYKAVERKLKNYI